jgi:hypothetical protein
MATERLPNSAFLHTKKTSYVDVFNLQARFEKLAFRSDMVLIGPKGIGKSIAFRHYAVSNRIHMVTFDCSSDVRRHHLFGSPTIRGNETPFVLGPIPTAIEIANEIGACILCFEELSALTPEAQKELNPLLDFRRRIEVPEAKSVYEVKDGAKLWVVGTSNTADYGGIHQFNEDLISRVSTPPLGYPSTEQELSIIESEVTGKGVIVDPDTTKKLLVLAGETRERPDGYALSPRDLVRVLTNTSLVGVSDALWLESGKFNGSDLKWYQDRVWALFGQLLPGAKAPAQTQAQAKAAAKP